MASGNRNWRGNSHAYLHRCERRSLGALRGSLPGRRLGADRRARSAHGRHAYGRTLFRSDRANIAKCFQCFGGTSRCLRRHVTETEHGAFGKRMSKASFRAGSGRSDGALHEARGSCGGTRPGVSLRRSKRSASDRTSQCDESTS